MSERDLRGPRPGADTGRRVSRQGEGAEAATAASVGPLRAPPVARAEDVDLSKAKPGHKRCNGTGIVGYKTINTVEGEVKIPIICRCVTRRGGVKTPGGEKLKAALAKENADKANERINQMTGEEIEA